MRLSQKLNIKVINSNENNEKPAIYVVNHTNIHDIPIACNVVRVHVSVLVENGVEHRSLNCFVLKINSAIFIDRKDKDNRVRAKNDMIVNLLNGKSILMFPEGTWNMSDNLIMLPLNWGVIEVAKKTGAPIVPLILEYDKSVVYASLGNPINVSRNDDKSAIIQLLRDEMATVRWDIWSKMDGLSRGTINDKYFDDLKNYYLKEYPKLNLEYENSIKYKPYEDPSDVFDTFEKIKIDSNNAFLLKNNDNKKILTKFI